MFVKVYNYFNLYIFFKIYKHNVYIIIECQNAKIPNVKKEQVMVWN